ncbi:hypothetical protein, partial [Staphylococcus aureus]|uniref:hypothetical protein n=1 Tax=Staphylococcus aureus TaxID=1280 RepID=UPI00065B75F1
SVFNGFRKWLSKTYDWIRDIGKDMGRAAADLGKNVANKAIGGLNSMIGGVYKKIKSIYYKKIIKPKTTIFYGTFTGKGGGTQKLGGFKQTTISVLNDRGFGKAPGGGGSEGNYRGGGTI